MSRFAWIILGTLAIGTIALVVRDDAGTVLGMENADFARLLWLGLIGVVIGSGIIFSGPRLGQAARAIAIWAFLLLLLVSGYQYRYELQDMGHRLTAGLIPASPMAMLDADGASLVVLDKMANGHFEVLADFSGQPVQMLVDTGASTTVLADFDAARLGFDPSSLNYTVSVMTANGPAQAARVRVDDITIGSISRQNVAVLVAEPGRLRQSLLGMNFINSLSGMDIRRDRLILRD